MRIEADIRKILESAMDSAIRTIQANMAATGTNATGKTSRSLAYRTRLEGRRIIGEITGRRFFGAVETGSRPAQRKGTAQEREQFQKSLEEWCRVRAWPAPGLTDEQYSRAARYLRWYLNQNGSALYRRSGRRDIVTPAVEWLRGYVRERVTEIYVGIVKTEIEDKLFPGYPDRN